MPPQRGDFVCLQTFLIFNFPALGHGLISVRIFSDLHMKIIRVNVIKHVHL